MRAFFVASCALLVLAWCDKGEQTMQQYSTNILGKDISNCLKNVKKITAQIFLQALALLKLQVQSNQ